MKEILLILGALTYPKEAMLISNLDKQSLEYTKLVHETLYTFNKKKLR